MIGRRRAPALAMVAFAGLSVLAACQPQLPSPLASPGATPHASEPAPSTGSQPLSSDGAIVVDPSLLLILPHDVDGAVMQPSPDAATEIAADPSMATDVEAIAVALAVSPGTSGAEDLVIASVVRLRPDIFGDVWFRDWRDTYDAAACEPAGGVVGNAESEIDGRQVFIGTCADGAHTYHVRYGEDVIVALTTVGEGRLGELVMSNLGD